MSKGTGSTDDEVTALGTRSVSCHQTVLQRKSIPGQMGKWSALEFRRRKRLSLITDDTFAFLLIILVVGYVIRITKKLINIQSEIRDRWEIMDAV